ncbi:ATP-grasp domain-containing protein [Paraburkholderia sp. JPY169]|uniref:ATP-grasp domain-containing protein n=1 Tax=Paraburkholderia youngii TaxID=2782701 RepID=A0A7Y6K9Z2_9BURK|nr:ATP-grasp domain-containing protein [Paraburkholderia youngii]
MVAIVVVEPVSSGTALIAAAQRLGHPVHVFCADTRIVPPTHLRTVASLTSVDTGSADDVAAAVRTVGGIDALVPGFEYAVDVVAQTAAQLGLPHLAPEAAALTRDKYRSRQRLSMAGLAVPRFAPIAKRGDVARAAAHVGFPAVVKPVDGCGSLLVRRVDSLAQLHATIDSVAHRSVPDMGREVGQAMMLEQYLDGPEYSVEGYVGPLGPRMLAITEKILGPEPYFVEMGHVVDATLDDRDRARLSAYVETVAREIGLTLGVFHAEVRMTRDGPTLIEIAARLGGDRIYRLVELAKSISLPEVMLRSYLGEWDPAPGYRHGRSTRVSGVRFLAPEAAGPFVGVSGLDNVRAQPGFQEAEIYPRIGDWVSPPTDFRGRVGHVLFTAPDRPTLERRLNDAQCALEMGLTCKVH